MEDNKYKEEERLELFHGYRERLKEEIRKKRMNKSTTVPPNNINNSRKKLQYDNYGSFFGPSPSSKPVNNNIIASRVIQEMSKSITSLLSSPKVVTDDDDDVKTKVQKLKDSRDYSFLMNDDDDDDQMSMKTKQALGNNVSHAKKTSSTPMSGHSSRLPSPSSRLTWPPMDSTRQHSSNNGTGPSRPSIKNGTGPSRPSSNNGTGPSRPSSNNRIESGRPSTSNRTELGRPSIRSNGTGPSRPSSNNRIESGRPSTKRTKSSISCPKNSSMPSMQKSLSSKLQPSISRQQQLEVVAKAKLLSRPQINKPQKQSSSHLTSYNDNCPKKKPMKQYSDDEGDEGEDYQAISMMIRQMFRYNPNKFVGRDDDDSNMVANFDDIQREEKRSERMGRRKDKKEQLLIEEEERREREAKMRRLKKLKFEH
ncbi:uncharacterized protein LOC115695553 [Cannabis sativa]|uniref:uncharacterized protein LOC115695553 n=1 Tax=Cannabis sativa TaxID=3483 RepID=UPI0029CA7191|nr:uncharacterized protein LOC115695553 [Cannabis sativa]